MMFEIIMNMPVRGNHDVKGQPALIHRIVCSHPAESLEEITAELQTKDYIIVEEWYPNQSNVYENFGPIALNHRFIGKIKLWNR